MDAIFGEIADSVITVVVPIAATAIIALGIKGYNRFAEWTGISKVALTAQQQSDDNATIQSALSNVAEGVKMDVQSGKVQLTAASLKAEALARVKAVQAKVPDALARNGVGTDAIANSLLAHIGSKIDAAPGSIPATSIAAVKPATVTT
jgi:preprotein translocase subunit SecF